MSAIWGAIQVGRLTLRETYAARQAYNMNTSSATLDLAGQESYPPLTRAQWQAKKEDMAGIVGLFLPVTFTNASDHDGYYQVVDAGADSTDWTRAADPGLKQAGAFGWTLRLEKVGPANAVDIESRTSSPGRANDYLQTGTRSHTPAGSAYGYTTGSAAPSGSVSRASADGTLTTYLGVPASASPRWAAALADYGKGRARFSVGGIERSGVNLSVPGSGGWSLDNGLVRVNASPSGSGTLAIAAYAAGTWGADAQWNISRGGSAGFAIGALEAVTVIRNDYELVTIRCVDTRAPGRNLLDLTLRRGSRLLEGYLQTDVSSTLAVSLAVAEAGTAPASAGYVQTNANDANGHRRICGSARSFTSLATVSGFQKAAVTALDFWIGHVVGGGAAVAGDQAAELQAQYIGAMAETTMGVRR